MKSGQEVSVIDAKGERHTATVIDVVGKGPSHFKRLDVTFRKDGEDELLADVPHENDAESGQVFWLEKGARRRDEDDGPTPGAMGGPELEAGKPPAAGGATFRKRAGGR